MSDKILGQMTVKARPSMIHARQGKLDSRSRDLKGGFPTLLALSFVLLLGTVGCHKTTAQGTSANAAEQSDPANVNMASVDGSGYAPAQPARVLGQSAQNEAQQQAVEYSQQPAPIERRAPYTGDQSYGNQGNYDPGSNDGSGLTDQQAADLYDSDLTDEQASEPPPPLPIYEQPPAPEPDYLWTPGYWAWANEGYYWVPGCWVAAPYRGALWTPGYWAFVGSNYRFHHGFWGLHIGFYGGVNYGFGYFGHGYYGGYWDNDHFRYNTAVNRIDRNRIPYVYARDVPVNYRRADNHVSFDGGRGGLHERPLAAEIEVLHERRNAPMQSQIQIQREAGQNRQQFFNQNRGRPGMAVAARPVAADRTPPAVLPAVARGIGQQGRPQVGGQQMRNGTDAARPGLDGRQVPQNVPNNQGYRQGQPQQGQPQVRQGQPLPQVNPNQPQPQGRSLRPQSELRPGQPQPQQIQPQQGQPQPAQPQPQFRRGQPQSDPNQLQLQGRPRSVQPQPQQARPPQPQPQVNSNQAQPQDRRFRPQPEMRQAQPQAQPQQPRPQPQIRQAQPQPQIRQAQPQPQVRQAQPQPQARPQQSRPQPQARPAPQPQKNDPHPDEKPHGQ
jgi:WXXGXW repeat (2 copies)